MLMLLSHSGPSGSDGAIASPGSYILHRFAVDVGIGEKSGQTYLHVLSYNLTFYLTIGDVMFIEQKLLVQQMHVVQH